MSEKDVSEKEKVDKIEITAPLLHLVPVPAFTMEEATNNFEMKVKEIPKDKEKDDSKVEYTSRRGWTNMGYTVNAYEGKIISHDDSDEQPQKIMDKTEKAIDKIESQIPICNKKI
ncbi:DUF2589 domain-containing protein [Clostridium sp. FS41]|uniref:DUF2589 domain-containing protein n=1 Tax=Clostridia TaxID=186801 RepID=UPI0005D33611|nr:DUF2589 domain-containing protein [Clostridium sp. FS41]KJJ66817.1 hypothetical protein CLFS41_49880 [Clostridium sp. FS41]